ncbi:PAS domain-containing protein, partial [Streptomyces sp. NRRL B-24572]
LPQRPVGTRSAGPVLPDALLPVAETRVRVAVAQIDRGGTITAWNEDAEELFGYGSDLVIGKPLGD